MVSSATADNKLDAFVTLRTATFVGRAVFIDVDAKVDVATVEFDADEFSLRCVLWDFFG